MDSGKSKSPSRGTGSIWSQGRQSRQRFCKHTSCGKGSSRISKISFRNEIGLSQSVCAARFVALSCRMRLAVLFNRGLSTTCPFVHASANACAATVRSRSGGVSWTASPQSTPCSRSLAARRLRARDNRISIAEGFEFREIAMRDEDQPSPYLSTRTSRSASFSCSSALRMS